MTGELRAALEQAYCWLVHFAHHPGGELRCSESGCERCEAMAVSNRLVPFVFPAEASA